MKTIILDDEGQYFASGNGLQQAIENARKEQAFITGLSVKKIEACQPGRYDLVLKFKLGESVWRNLYQIRYETW